MSEQAPAKHRSDGQGFSAQHRKLESQLRAVNEAARRIAGLSSGTEIREAVLDAMEALFGEVGMCIYRLGAGGSVHPFGSRPEEPQAVAPVVKIGQGHAGRVLEHGQPLLVGDLDASAAGDPEFSRQDFRGPIRSVLTVPMTGEGGRPIGTLQVLSTERDGFQESHIPPFAILANCVATALERAELRAALGAEVAKVHAGTPWASKLLELAHRRLENGIQLIAARNELYEELLNEALRSPSAIRGCVRLCDRQPEQFRFFLTAGPGWTDEKKLKVYGLKEKSACTRAVTTRRLFRIGDVAHEEHYVPLFPDVQSHVSVPIFLRDRVVAVLSLDGDVVDAFDDTLCAELEHLISECSNLLSHFALLQDSWLYELEKDLRVADDVKPLCRAAVKHVLRLFGVRGCSIFLRYPDMECLRLVATTSPKCDEVETPVYPIGEGLTGWVAKHRKCLRLRNTADQTELAAVADDLEWKELWSEKIRYEDVQGHFTFLAAPLTVRDRLVGVIRLTIKENKADFEVEDEILIQRVADRLAVSVDHSWLHDQSQRRVEELSSFVTLGDHLLQTLALDAVCQGVLEGAAKIVGADTGYIRVFDKAARNLRLVWVIGPHQDVIPKIRGLGEGLSGVVAQDQELRLIPDLSKDAEYLAAWEKRTGQSPEMILGWLQRKACLPLIAQEEVVGTLSLQWRRAAPFTGAELKLMSDLANRSALAIKAALMLQEIEGELKQKIQALSKLREVGMVFAQTLDLDQLLKAVLDSALRFAGVSVGTLRVLDEHQKKWVLKAAKDEAGASLGQRLASELELKGTLLQRAVGLEKSLVFEDARTHPGASRAGGAVRGHRSGRVPPKRLLRGDRSDTVEGTVHRAADSGFQSPTCLAGDHGRVSGHPRGTGGCRD